VENNGSDVLKGRFAFRYKEKSIAFVGFGHRSIVCNSGSGGISEYIKRNVRLFEPEIRT
jgi:hypothetical protein